MSTPESENVMDNPTMEKQMDINTEETMKGTSHLNEPVTPESELEKLRKEVDDLKDKYLRQVAEFDNYRKRNAKERLELLQTAGKDVIIPLLEVLDDCDRAEKQLHQTDDIKLIREGVALVFQKFRNTLQARGLKAMESRGTEFNPDQHEAITEIQVPEESQKGKVVDEIEKGYYLNDKIIRFAKVIVGK